MFITIQPHEIVDNAVLMTQMFKLRKRVFHDQLGWDVPIVGELEVDAYDSQNASYLIWCSDNRKTLYAMVRLMPTDGPTLLHDVFGPTHGYDAALIGARVWEGTRMCVDEAALARDMPNIDAGEGFRLLLLALCEVSLAHGITRLVSNFEAPLSRIYRRAGLTYHLHGRADCYSDRPVFCASFDVSPACLARMRATIGIDVPLYRYSATTTSLVAAPVQVGEAGYSQDIIAKDRRHCSAGGPLGYARSRHAGRTMPLVQERGWGDLSQRFAIGPQ